MGEHLADQLILPLALAGEGAAVRGLPPHLAYQYCGGTVLPVTFNLEEARGDGAGYGK